MAQNHSRSGEKSFSNSSERRRDSDRRGNSENKRGFNGDRRGRDSNSGFKGKRESDENRDNYKRREDRNDRRRDDRDNRENGDRRRERNDRDNRRDRNDRSREGGDREDRGFKGRRDGGFRKNDRGPNREKNRRPNHNQKKSGTAKGGFSKQVIVEPHRRFPGIFVSRGKEDALCTKNMVPGVSVYNEKRIITAEKAEYRTWNPYRSKLAAGITSGLENIHIVPGSKVLYLGAASGTSVSHVSDMVGDGIVYAVEFSQRSGRDLINLAKKRNNIVPIIEDARHPHKYRMLVPLVDVIFSDVAQPDQARIVALNAQYFLKEEGHVLMSIKANCVDSTKAPEAVFAMEVDKLKKESIKPIEKVNLEPYEKDHAIVVGAFLPSLAK
ncbi:hypothetical protein EDEG_03572 [Edhazardia aedis USNM 41457]|uniref:rRNA 2'-O-methyltransferase fibrillarin n=1 Tax=Edhazardia aedis (strain USNM 41457) TaxID=1003232 RepID=J9D318_EDHAE|nr:hypothetical protein EDEG_03572 [Edhazardia aedis USNM 41457]|eukprot:EJW01964.1 hypothetical protein EDEG_03572 [Edhazardia aedis USNM 41457]